MNVKELKEELAKWSDDTIVVIDIGDYSYPIDRAPTIYGSAKLTRMGGGVEILAAGIIGFDVNDSESNQIVWSELEKEEMEKMQGHTIFVS